MRPGCSVSFRQAADKPSPALLEAVYLPWAASTAVGWKSKSDTPTERRNL